MYVKPKKLTIGTSFENHLELESLVQWYNICLRMYMSFVTSLNYPFLFFLPSFFIFFINAMLFKRKKTKEKQRLPRTNKSGPYINSKWVKKTHNYMGLVYTIEALSLVTLLLKIASSLSKEIEGAGGSFYPRSWWNLHPPPSPCTTTYIYLVHLFHLGSLSPI